MRQMRASFVPAHLSFKLSTSLHCLSSPLSHHLSSTCFPSLLFSFLFFAHTLFPSLSPNFFPLAYLHFFITCHVHFYPQLPSVNGTQVSFHGYRVKGKQWVLTLQNSLETLRCWIFFFNIFLYHFCNCPDYCFQLQRATNKKHSEYRNTLPTHLE